MRRRPRKKLYMPELMISPMIDMMFLMLLFFIVSTMFMSDVRTLPIQLPTAAHADYLQQDKAFAVTVKKDGSLFLEDKPVERNLLLADAAKASKDSSTFAVIVRAEADTDYKTVIKLLDELKGAGVTRFGLATELGEAK